MVDLVQLECWWREADNAERCGRIFGVTHQTHEWMRINGGTVHCPAGHKIRYGATALSKAEEALARERAAHDQTRADRDTLKRKEKKMARRLKAGVCPCCQRTFTNMARHMTTKHPEYPK